MNLVVSKSRACHIAKGRFLSATGAKSRVIGVASTDVGNLNNGLSGTSIHLKLVGLMSKHP